MADMAVRILGNFFLQLLIGVSMLIASTKCLSEQGIFEYDATKEGNTTAITKAMYAGSYVSLKISCPEVPVKIRVDWLLRLTPCAEEYVAVDQQPKVIEMYMQYPQLVPVDMDMKYKTVKFLQGHEKSPDGIECHGATLAAESVQSFTNKSQWQEKEAYRPDEHTNKTVVVINSKEKRSQPENGDVKRTNSREKRVAESQPEPTADRQTPTPAKEAPTPALESPKASPTPKIGEAASGKKPGDDKQQLHRIAVIPEDGIYLFVLKITPIKELEKKQEIRVTVDMKGPHGYLSATEWPLLPFYASMCVVYLVFGVIWLVLLGCNWRDLLRVQFWIGGVILLGMLEKAVFFAEYESVNTTGRSVRGALIFAELVSSLKRALARMLVVIVSLGFGIVKPRLGPMLHRVLGMGLLYFILASVEGCMRVLRQKSDQSKQLLIANIPLAVLDAAICWWIFTSLVQTTRTLRLRRNVVKLTLYRHFTNTLIFCILASVAYMIWSIKQHRLSSCLSDWKELWVDEAFWHLLFSIILMVIMILWRPSANNQRYAFSPLLTEEPEDADEPTMNDAFEGMKLRGKNVNGNPVKYEPQDKAEDDLKWVDEHIPASVADTALPSLLDSDEEIMTTKFEQSKME